MNRRSLIKSALFLGSLCAGGVYWKNRWRYIVIHHSAGSFGDIAFLQKVHRQRQANDPINAIAYHYIIGNGNGMGMGEIASDWRQRYHIWGAHVSGRNIDYNLRGIGICLIGNFENHTVPPEQYLALRRLTKTLMRKYVIPAHRVSGHGMITGESTKCPGKHFPMNQLNSDLA